MLAAGTLKRPITIQSPNASQDATGQPVAGWTDLLSTFACVRAATSKEVYAASGFASQVSHVITIRYPAIPLQSGVRVLYEARVFLVQAVTDPDESKVQLNLLCLENNASV